jgi:phosphoribosylanthranilate isomerase
MLSGGLNASNVGDAVARTNPSGLDISSGVERTPGIKDVALIESFFAAIRSATQRAA